MTIDIKNNRIYHFDEEANLIEHRPFSTGFKEIEVLANGDLLIIEDDHNYAHVGRSNLYCLGQQMHIKWFLRYPHMDPNPMDAYVGFTTHGAKIYANTFSCYRVEIDTVEGEILSVTFTK